LKRVQNYSEVELVIALKSGDKHAFSYLYDNYSSALFGVISRIVQDEEHASDILQESFIKIWKNIHAYDDSKGKLFTWLLNICRNSAIDYIRSNASRMSAIHNVDAAVYQKDKQLTTTDSNDHIGLKEVLTQLKADQQELISLAFYKGYTHLEISKELNLPLGTVKTRIRSALIQLREILKVKL
jgi:RNA polymerase sigma factor (sigma-70 family)